MACINTLVAVICLFLVRADPSVGFPSRTNNDGLNDGVALKRVARNAYSSRTFGFDSSGLGQGHAGISSSFATGGQASGEAEGSMRAKGGASGGFNLGFGLLRGLSLSGQGETHGEVDSIGRASGRTSGYGNKQVAAEAGGEIKGNSGFLFGGLFGSRNFDANDQSSRIGHDFEDDVYNVMSSTDNKYRQKIIPPTLYTSLGRKSRYNHRAIPPNYYDVDYNNNYDIYDHYPHVSYMPRMKSGINSNLHYWRNYYNL